MQPGFPMQLVFSPTELQLESKFMYITEVQGRREAINIGEGGGGVSSCFDQHFLGF